jgi:hypothetical protein
MELLFKKAERRQKKGKIALQGPSGSGKTYTGLLLARGLAGPEGRIVLADSERSSGALYAQDIPGGYDHVNLPDREYETYIAVIKQAEAMGYEAIVIDSLSHAWEAFLEMHELEAARSKNSYTAWSKITPKYQRLIDTLVSANIHVIATMRSKTEYVLTENDKGKQAPKKVGMAPIMRPGSEYEFDLVATIDLEHNFYVEKTRCRAFDSKAWQRPGIEIGAAFKKWLESGAPAEAAQSEDEEDSEGSQEPAAQPALPHDPRRYYDLEKALSGKTEAEADALKKWLASKGGNWIEDTALWEMPARVPKLDPYEVRLQPQEAA